MRVVNFLLRSEIFLYDSWVNLGNIRVTAIRLLNYV